MEAVMNIRPSILCPIDYSDASAAALRYAAAIAEHFLTRLIVLSVEDPLLTTAMNLETGVAWTREAFASVQPYAAGRRYVGYLAADDAGQDPVRAAYGRNYDRLVELKRKYDPDNLFHLNFNVSPA